jgi:hypothetical protein
MDEKTLVVFSDRILNNNPSRVLDASNREFSVDARQLIVYSLLDSPRDSALDALRNSRQAQSRMYYGFMCMGTPGVFDCVVLMNTGLSYGVPEGNYDQPMFLLHGPLSLWRSVVIDGCWHEDTETRRFFNSVYRQFDKIGLAEIWFGCRRVENKDGTFALKP